MYASSLIINFFYTNPFGLLWQKVSLNTGNSNIFDDNIYRPCQEQINVIIIKIYKITKSSNIWRVSQLLSYWIWFTISFCVTIGLKSCAL